MSDFDIDLDKFNLKLQSIINSYDGLDSKSPVSPSMVDKIRDIVDLNYHHICDNLLRLNKVVDTNTNSFQNDLVLHNKKVNELNKDYQKRISLATQDIQAQIDSKKYSIKESYEANKNKNDDLGLDTDTFINSSNLNIDMLRNDAKNDIAKYTYQYTEAKYTYDEDAENYNEETFKKLDESEKNHKKSEQIFHSQIDEIIKNYEYSLEKVESQLEELRLNHIDDIKKINEEKRNLSIELNNKIKELNITHSSMANTSKQHYQETQNKLLEERNTKKNEYLKLAQDSNKEFITSTEQNLKRHNEAKELYVEKANEILENNYYDLYLNHLEEEKELYELNKSHNINKNCLIKKVKRKSYSYYKNMMNETKKQIKTLENEFNKKVNEYQSNKILIDSSRQTAIKKYNENELKDNKYYQEKNNQADDLSNYEISLDSYEINKKINNIRHLSDMKLYELEAEADALEAKYLKNNEKLLTEKRKCILEIESSHKLKELVSEMIQKKHNKEIMYLRVTGALYIERCKKLLEYNERQLEIYTKISNSLFDYSQKKIELQNDARRAINECKLNINNIMLDLHIMNVNNDISILGNREQYESRKLFMEFTYKKEKTINETLRKRFEYEIRDINHHTSSLLIIFNALENILIKTTNVLLNDNIKNPKDFEFNKKFLEKIKVELYEFAKISIDNYKKVIIELIDQTIKFEAAFKFEVSFNSSNDHFNEENLRINNNISDTKKRIEILKDEINKENKTIQNLLYGVKNDKSASKQDLLKQIQTLKKDISNKNKLLKGYNNSIKRLNNELKDLVLRHNREIKDISTMQKTNTVSLYKLNTMVQDLTEKLAQGLDEKYQYINKIEVPFDSYKDALKEKYIALRDYMNVIYYDVYSIIKTFKTESIKYHKAGETTLNNSFSSSIKELAKENSKNLRNQNQRFVQEYTSKNRDLNIARKKESNTEHLYRTYDRRLDNSYAVDNKEKKLLLTISETQLYRELNAINQNMYDIKMDYLSFNNRIETEYKNSRFIYFKEAQNKKQICDNNLVEYLMQRDIDIKRIPNALKHKNLVAVLDLKDRNKDIDNSISEMHISYSQKKKKSKNQIDIILQNYNKNIAEIDKEQSKYIKKAANLRKA